jgi:hypothetical protein
MGWDSKRELAIYVLSGLRTTYDLAACIESGVNSSSFEFDSNLQSAFDYICRRISSGKAVSKEDIQRLFGIELREDVADLRPYAEEFSKQLFIESLHENFKKMTDLLYENPWQAYRTFQARMSRLLVPIRYRDDTIQEMTSVRTPDNRRWWIPDVLPEGWPCILYGKGGQGKGYLAVYLSLCLSQGRPFLDRPVRQVPVLYLDWEMDRDEFVRKAVEIWTGTFEAIEQEEWSWPNLYYRRCTLPIADMMAELSDFIYERKIGVVLIDSFGFAVASGQRSTKDVTKSSDILSTMALLQQLPATVVIIDHEPRGSDNPFGSIYKENATRWIWRVTSEHDPDNPSVLFQHLEVRKGNIDSKKQDLYTRLEWRPVETKNEWERRYSLLVSAVAESDVPVDIRERWEDGKSTPTGDVARIETIRFILENLRREGVKPVAVDVQDIGLNLGVSASQAYRWAEKMVMKGLLSRVSVKTGKGGRPRILYGLPGDTTGSGNPDVEDL